MNARVLSYMDDDYDLDFGGDTDVIDMPLRPPAAVIHDRVPMDAVPVHVRPERTRPYRFPRTRIILNVVI